jgi:hypothetical protein
MNVLGLFAAYVTLFAAGLGVVILLLRTSIRLRQGYGGQAINLIECAALSWLFGAGVVSLLLWLGGIVFSGLVLQLFVTLVCVVLGFIAWKIKRTNAIRFSLPRPSNRLEWILASLLAFELITIFFVSLKHTLGWDGLLNWEIKARYAFLNSGALPQSYYSSPGRAFSHPEYPLAIPFTELWLYLWMGAPHQFWIKTIFPLFYISGALLLAMFITRLTGKRWLGLLIPLLMPFVPFMTASPGGVTVGYADIPLAVFYLTALGYLLLSSESDSQQTIILFGATLAFVPWVKSEGVILWSLLALLGLIVGFVQRRIRQFVFTILPGLLLIIGWRVYLKAMHTILPSDFAHPTFELLTHNLNRVGIIFRVLLAEASEPSHWSIFWLLAIVAVIYLVAARKFSRFLLAIGLLGPLALYLATYLFSAWPSYTAHITSSLPRLLLQLMPATWLGIGLALSRTRAERKEQPLG